MFKVITDVTTEPVTLAEARLHLKLLESNETTEDSLITAWITAAREKAEQYTGRALAPKTLEMAFDEFPAYSFDLDMSPVSSVTSIKYTDNDGVEQTVDSGDYALSTYGLENIIAPAYDFTWPTARAQRDAVRVRYATGYSTVPKSVKSALLLMIAWLFEHRGEESAPHEIQPAAARALLDSIRIVRMS